LIVGTHWKFLNKISFQYCNPKQRLALRQAAHHSNTRRQKDRKNNLEKKKTVTIKGNKNISLYSPSSSLKEELNSRICFHCVEN
jgi:hypothetical protein